MFLAAEVVFTPETAILIIPAAAAAVLALLPGYWVAARLNVLAAITTE